MYWAAVKASRGSVNSEELEKELMTMANELACSKNAKSLKSHAPQG